MKRLPLFLLIALCGLSVSLALGWWEIYKTKKAIDAQVKQNQELIYRNAALQAEIQDLKSSRDAVQERARLQLGMIKRDEVFVQVMDQPSAVQPGVNTVQTQNPQAQHAPPAPSAQPASNSSNPNGAGSPAAEKPKSP